MRIIFFLVLIFLLLVSCKESTSQFDSLPQVDQDYIRTIATAKCLSTNTPYYNNFKDQSETVFTTNTSFDRGDGFFHELKATGYTKSVDIRIWKRTATEIYFYITNKVPATTQYFLRVKLSENELMIDRLLTDHCDKTYVSSASSGSLSVVKEHDITVAPNRDHYKDTYSFNFSYLAYFASFNLSRSVITYDTSNVQVGTTISYASTLVAKVYTFDSTDATDAALYTQSFCEIDDVGGTYPLATSSEGFLLGTCVASPLGPSGDWDLTVI